jgi:hypothetical protein
VALKELDARGRVLRTVKLPRTERCAKHEPETRSHEIRTLARGSLPGGGGFSIVGERVKSEYGGSYSDLNAEVTTEEVFGGSRSEIAGGEGSQTGLSNRFSEQLKTGCQPHEYAIVYGVVQDPSSSVLARTSTGLEALHRARIPASLRLGRELAYIALPAVPVELLVRSRSGKVVARESLSRRAREARETCEGEAEG